MLNDLFGRARLPADFSREGRVRLLGEAFDALLRNEMPSDEARLFLAGGGLAWLERGGDLLGDYWRVRGTQGSTHTPAVIWSLLQSSSGRATEGDRMPTIEPSESISFGADS